LKIKYHTPIINLGENSMKKLVLFILILSVCMPLETSEGNNLRHSIMVSTFENRSNWSGQWRLGETFGALLTDSLQQTGKFIVLGEMDMRLEAMAEQDFGASGRTAGGKKTPKIGQMTPAQLLVKGEITHFQHSTTGGGAGIRIKGFKIGGKRDKAEINAVIYVVDSTTGQVVSSKKVVGEASKSGLDIGFSDRNWGANLAGFKKTNVGKAVESAIDQAVQFIIQEIEDIPWEGTVILVKGQKIYINRGERDGVSIGQTFAVGDVEELRDPDTGELLDVSMEKTGSIVIDTVKKKVSIGKATAGAGNIRKGMTIMVP
jgi:curli biogenesis system outer membrane secretion channel CsgG